MLRFIYRVTTILYIACFIFLGDWAWQVLVTSFDIWPRKDSPILLRASLYARNTDSYGQDDENSIGNYSRILLMSSVGRSGSSFLGQLLSMQPKTLYIFEPILYLQRYTKDGVTPNSSRKLLNDLYNCQFDLSWTIWARSRRNVLHGVSFDQKRQQNRTLLTFPDVVSDECYRSCHRIIKVIKMRVSWVEEMLRDSDSSLKVIHLVRDPRASFASLERRNMIQKNYTLWCPKIKEDLQLVSKMENLFPKSFISLTYEDLCNDPLGTSTRLWRFLTGGYTNPLPVSWKRYLEEHTSTSVTGAPDSFFYFGTVRDSRKEAEAWRLKIQPETLLAVEKHCGDVLNLLKYNKFGSLDNVRNLSLPLKRQD